MVSTCAVKPNHYRGVFVGDTEVTTIDVIEQLCEISTNDRFTDYNRFQSFKYIWRAGMKDDVLQDLKKGRQFLDFAIEKLEKDRANNS